MPTPKDDRGILRPYHARYGLTIDKCLGIWKEPDPGAIPDEALQDAINARIWTGGLTERGGQSAATTAALLGCPYGAVDVPTPAQIYAWNAENLDTFTYRNGPGGATGTYSHIYQSGGTFQIDGLMQYDDKIIVTTFDNPNWYYEVVKGQNEITGTSYTAQKIFEANGDFNDFAVVDGIKSDGSAGQILFIATSGGLGNDIYSWDGTSLTLDARFSTGGDLFLGAGFGTIFAYVNDNPNPTKLYKRTGPEAWTEIAMPAGMYPLWFTTRNAMLFYQDKMVIGATGLGGSTAFDQGLLFVDEHDVASIGHVIVSTSPGSTPGSPRALEIYDGLLLYAWARGSAGPLVATSSFIGNYDGTTWNDEVVELHDAFSDVSTPTITSMLNGDSILYIMAINEDGSESLYGIVDATSPHTLNASDVLQDLDAVAAFAAETMVIG
jgi:hypothetical protein